jgi:hypothetical protein
MIRFRRAQWPALLIVLVLVLDAVSHIKAFEDDDEDEDDLYPHIVPRNAQRATRAAHPDT